MQGNEVVTEKADPDDPGHVAAPFQGVAAATVQVGDEVQAGDAVAMIEGMKMESSSTTPVTGVVRRIVVPTPRSVEARDLILVVENTTAR
ncbi:biotin/lipoyl-containing protein [Gordonia iterans]